MDQAMGPQRARVNHVVAVQWKWHLQKRLRIVKFVAFKTANTSLQVARNMILIIGKTWQEQQQSSVPVAQALKAPRSLLSALSSHESRASFYPPITISVGRVIDCEDALSSTSTPARLTFLGS